MGTIDRDHERYGSKIYYADLELEDKAKHVFKGEEIEISKPNTEMRLKLLVPNYPDTERWENAMYDRVFDTCKGTEWSKVKNIKI